MIAPNNLADSASWYGALSLGTRFCRQSRAPKGAPLRAAGKPNLKNRISLNTVLQKGRRTDASRLGKSDGGVNHPSCTSGLNYIFG
jgi:hypothetical protein